MKHYILEYSCVSLHDKINEHTLTHIIYTYIDTYTHTRKDSYNQHIIAQRNNSWSLSYKHTYIQYIRGLALSVGGTILGLARWTGKRQYSSMKKDKATNSAFARVNISCFYLQNVLFVRMYVCMYVCMHVCMCMCVYVCKHEFMDVCIELVRSSIYRIYPPTMWNDNWRWNLC